MKWQRFAMTLVAVVALSACGTASAYFGGADDAAVDAVPVSADDSDTSGGAITVAASAFGDILVDGAGRTLYLFDSDTDATSTCVDDCASTWPALSGDATAGAGVAAGQLGVTQRSDGTTQTTYAGRPLYHFAGDQAPGDTNGQGVGDVWWVVGPDGVRITEAAAATSDQAEVDADPPADANPPADADTSDDGYSY